MRKKIKDLAERLLHPRSTAVAPQRDDIGSNELNDPFEIDLNTDPATQRTLAQVVAMFSPVVDQLNTYIRDISGQMKFRLLAVPKPHIFNGKPEIDVTISFTNDKEDEAMRFYNTEAGGACAYYAEGTAEEKKRKDLTWSKLSYKSFNFSVPVSPKRKRLVFFGMWKHFNTPASYTKDPNKVLQGMGDTLFGEHSFFAEFFAKRGRPVPLLEIKLSLPSAPDPIQTTRQIPAPAPK